MPQYPDQSSFAEPLNTHPEAGVVGTFDAITQTGKTLAQPDGVQYGGIPYTQERGGAWALFTAGLRAFFDDPAPYKVAEETQIANITYAEVVVKAQDPSRMNDSQYTASVNRQRGPKVGERPTTTGIVGNLASGPSSLDSGDAAIMSLLGL